MRRLKKLNRMRMLSWVLAFVTVLSTVFGTTGIETQAADKTTMRGMSAAEIVADMGAGWNMGNSLESENNETYWGNPKITREMVNAIANQGFTTIRIPVRWDDNYSDASSYTISSSYMDRVEEVVNYGLDAGLYVIINVHHNDLQTMVSTDYSTQQRVKNELQAIWTQVGNRFKNYGDKLVFEVNNEPRCGDDWGGNTEYYNCVNQYNEVARAAIRATGGNNTERLVMLPTYCASADSPKVWGWDNLTDSDDMIAVSIHAYKPWDFAYEGNGHSNWIDSDYTELKGIFEELNAAFVSKGIPVVIGEFGATDKSNYSDRTKYAEIYASFAKQYGMACIWWDNHATGYGGEHFGIFDRNSCTFIYPDIANAMINVYGKSSGNTGNTGSSSGSGSSGSTESSGNYVSLFWGDNWSSNWGQAVDVATTRYGGSFDASNIKAGGHFYVEYSGTEGELELILQSMSGGASWAKVSPSEKGTANGHYYAKYSYDNCVSAFGSSNFSGLLDKIYVGATSTSINVYSLCYDFGSTSNSGNTGNSGSTDDSGNTGNTEGTVTGGFYVDGTTIRDANGNAFVMRGVNVAHAWYTGNTEESIKGIAATGANAVRVVLSDGQTYTKTTASEVENIINLCKQNNLICILEVHDATGSDDTNALNQAVNYWKELKDILNNNKAYVIVNIANEWYGTWNGSAWAEGNKSAVKSLRDAGIENMLIVDCAGWGQYPDSIKEYGKSVYEADTLGNTVFSIHMYEYAGGDSTMVKNNINNALGIGVPVIIGEFGCKHTDGDVDEYTIMSYCQEKGVGYFGWSWKGNGDTWSYLDLAYNWDGSSLSDWENTLVYDTNGIKNTSKICSVYEGGVVVPTATPAATATPAPAATATPAPTAAPTATPDSSENYISLFYGDAWSSNWGQAVDVATTRYGGSFDASNIKQGGHFYVEYAGTEGELELIFQSMSGGNGWAKISPSEKGWINGHCYAKYSYDNCVAAFGSSDFAGLLDKIYVGATSTSINVYSLCYDFGNSSSDSSSSNSGSSDSSSSNESDPYVSVFWGNSYASWWNQAASTMTSKNGGSFDGGNVTYGGYFYVEYSGSEKELELILQSWSGGANWAKVDAYEYGSVNGNYYAKFSYDACVSAFGSNNFSGLLDQIHVGAKNGEITVYSVCYCYPR